MDALAQTKPTVVEAVVAGIGIEVTDGGADRHRQPQQIGKHHGVVDVGGRWQRPEGNPVGRDDKVILGPRLAAIGRVRPGVVPPFGAFTMALSRLHHFQSIPRHAS